MDDRIIKYFLDELSKEESLLLLRELDVNEELKTEFIKYQNTHALLNLGKQIEDRKLGKKKFSEFLKQKQQHELHQRIKRWLSYAAVIVLFLASGALVSWFLNRNESDILFNTLSTPAGQRAQLILQDGTEVWLNAKSKLVYPSAFKGKERRVEVEGEAFFKVAKNPKKPFIVTTKNVDLKVLGTQFNLYSYPETDYVQTSLLEGSIFVSMKDNTSKGIYLKPNQQITVRNGQMKVEPIAEKEHFLWIDGIYAFEHEPLISILKKLELYYDVKIIVEDPSIFNDTYTGKFRQRDSLDDVFRILQQIRQFKVSKNPERNIITLSK